MKNRFQLISVMIIFSLLLSACSQNTSVNTTASQSNEGTNQASTIPVATPFITENIEATPAPSKMNQAEIATPTQSPLDIPSTSPQEPFGELPTASPRPENTNNKYVNALSYTPGDAPVIMILPQENTSYIEKDTPLLFIEDFQLLVLSQGFDLLQNSFTNNHPGITNDKYQTMADNAFESYYELEDPSYFAGYFTSSRAELTRCDTIVTSFHITHSDYTGGAHGMYGHSGETYLVETGELLDFDDILVNKEEFKKEAIPYITESLWKSYGDGLFDNYKTYVESSFSQTNQLNWYLDSSGIVIIYNPYELGPYAMGAAQITLPYSHFGLYIKDEYLTPPSEVITKVTYNQDISYLINIPENLEVSVIPDEFYKLDVAINIGSSRYPIGTYDSIREAYLMKRSDNRCYLIISCDHMSDDYITYIFEIEEGKLKKHYELTNMIFSTEYITTDSLKMDMNLNILGSYTAKVVYHFSEDGIVAPLTDYIHIDSQFPLTIIKELPVQIDNEKTTLSAGTQIIIYGVDREHLTIDFTTVDENKLGTIHYTLNPEFQYIEIDGVSEFEYFEYLPYAG